MFTTKGKSFIYQGSHNYDLAAIANIIKKDEAEVGRLFDNFTVGSIEAKTVLQYFEGESKIYEDCLEDLLTTDNALTWSFKKSTLPFIYEDLLTFSFDLPDDDSVMSVFYDLKLLARNNGDLFNPGYQVDFSALGEISKETDFNTKNTLDTSCWKLKTIGRRKYYIFNEDSYNSNVDYVNSIRDKNNRCWYSCWDWQDVIQEAETIMLVRRKARLVYNFLVDCLQRNIKNVKAIVQPAPTTTAEQDVANGKPWKDNYEAVIRLYPLFKDHLPVLLEKEYVIDNNKTTLEWTTDKKLSSHADLARYFKEILPKSSRSRMSWYEIITLFGLSIKPATLGAYISRKAESETFTKLCKTLDIKPAQQEKSKKSIKKSK